MRTGLILCLSEYRKFVKEIPRLRVYEETRRMPFCDAYVSNWDSAYVQGRNNNITLSAGGWAVHHTLRDAKFQFRIFGRQREFGFALFPSYPSKAGRPHHLLRVGVKIGQVESSVALAKRGFIR